MEDLNDSIVLTIDCGVVDEYNCEYLSQHTRAKKKPIKHPYHESINVWMIMKRPMMNSLKQKWKSFIVWFIDKQGYSNLRIDKCDLEFLTYYPNDRSHDTDNSTPKFIIDGLVDSGFIVDDDHKHVTSLLLACDVDRENPRTVITVKKRKD